MLPMINALKVQTRRPAMKKNGSSSVKMKETRGAKNAPSKMGSQASDYQAVVGLDVGDQKTHYCVLGLDGELVAEGSVATREASLRVQFEGKPRMRIALEAGAHSPWLSRLWSGWATRLSWRIPGTYVRFPRATQRMIRPMRDC